ncbi:hypothetical protein GJAV_G00063990 [Gymnothorax javanicus]|nr:hypothetical protein GJAV_G00063990 [Gymnothorax javanicus]
MEEDIFNQTLAYRKSPKTSKRTSFQDELQAAIAARARQNYSEESYNYADDSDDDDALEQLLSLRKKKMDSFRAGKKKAVEFQMPDEHQTNVKLKRVSFLKSQRESFSIPSDSGRDAMENGTSGSRSGSSRSSRSDRSRPKSVQFRLERSNSDSSRSRSASPRPPLTPERSEERQEVVPSTGKNQAEMVTGRQEVVTYGERRETLVGSQGEEVVTDSGKSKEIFIAMEKAEPRGGEKKTPVPQPRERKKSPRSGSPLKEEQPKPRPRQRAPTEGCNAGEVSMLEQEVSRPPTSPVSIPLSSAEGASSTSSAAEVKSFGDQHPQRTEEASDVLSQFSPCSLSGGQLSDSLSRSTDAVDALLKELDNGSHKDENGSTSSEVKQEGGEEDCSSKSGQQALTEILNNNSQGLSKKRPKSAPELAAVSRYLGTLKVLDDFAAQIKSQPDMADSVRATVYQEWRKTKEKVIKETIKIKKQEEQLREEKKKQEEESRRVDAEMSFAAWNEKKSEVLKAKLKEKQEAMKKLQQETDEKVERKEMAKKVFEKWKTTQDAHLREQHRKQKRDEKQLKQKEEMQKQERKKDCMSTMSSWCQVKEKNMLEQVRRKRREEKMKEEEERRVKEEKGQMALDMYEKWLVLKWCLLKKKERQDRRERNQRKISAILRDEPPPPWSPPNKTVPFGR